MPSHLTTVPRVCGNCRFWTRRKISRVGDCEVVREQRKDGIGENERYESMWKPRVKERKCSN
jgi:hypothetical protein